MSALLAACGGGGSDNTTPSSAPTALPTTVAVQSTAQAQAGSDLPFSTDLDAGLSGLSYAWTFGDGTTSTEARPAHRYAAPGDYTVSVTVRNSAGQSRTASYGVHVGFFDNVAGRVCSGASDGRGWCWQQPLPTGQQINDVQFLDADNGWAVGESGTVLRTRDGGGSWTRQTTGTTVDLMQVRFSDAQNGWALSNGNAVLHTTDGGTTWAVQALSYNNGYGGSGSFWALDAQRAVYVGNGGTYTTSTAGATWTPTTSFTPTVVTPNGTWWAFDWNGVRTSRDNGQTATVALARPAQTYSLDALAFADDLHGLLLTREPVDPGNYSSGFVYVVWRTADGGTSWSRQAPSLPQSSYAYNTWISYDSRGEAWLSDGQALWRSADQGTSWTPVALPASLGYYTTTSQNAIDGRTLWFAYGSSAYLTRDGGATWRTLTVTGESTLPRLREAGGSFWLSYGDYYGTANTRVYRSTDGTTWQRVLGPDVQATSTNLQAVWFFDARRGVAVSNDGTVMETANGGQTWSRKSLVLLPSSNYYYYGGVRLQFQSDSVGWMLANGSAIYKTTDGGASWWAPALSTPLSGVTDFHLVDAQQGWAVDASGHVLRSTDGGQSWTQQASVAAMLLGVRFASASAGIAVGYNGAVAVTTDGGAHWQPRASGTSQVLRRVTWSDTTTAWAVGDAGTVLRSTDAGASWSTVAVPSNSTLYDIVFLDAQHGWIVGDYGTVLRTDDGGRSWVRQATGASRSFYSAVFRDLATGWLVGSGGAILATATGGQP